MTTCAYCESVSGRQIRMDVALPGELPGQDHLDAYNAKLEELRGQGYAWVPESQSMVKPCAHCKAADAAPEENAS